MAAAYARPHAQRGPRRADTPSERLRGLYRPARDTGVRRMAVGRDVQLGRTQRGA